MLQLLILLHLVYLNAIPFLTVSPRYTIATFVGVGMAQVYQRMQMA